MKRLIIVMAFLLACSGIIQAQSWLKTYSFDGDSTKSEQTNKLLPKQNEGYFLFTYRGKIDTCQNKKTLVNRENIMYHLDKDGNILHKKRLLIGTSLLGLCEINGISSKNEVLVSGTFSYDCSYDIPYRFVSLLDENGEPKWCIKYPFPVANYVSAGIHNDTIIVGCSKYNLIDSSLLTYHLFDIQGNEILRESKKYEETRIIPNNFEFAGNHFYHNLFLEKSSIGFHHIQKISKKLDIRKAVRITDYLPNSRFRTNKKEIIIQKNDYASNFLRYDLDLNFLRQDSFSLNNHYKNSGIAFISKDATKVVSIVNNINWTAFDLFTEYEAYFSIHTLEGKLIFIKKDKHKGSFYQIIDNDNAFLVIGASLFGIFPTKGVTYRPVLYKTDASQSSIINYIKGTVAKDSNLDCKIDTATETKMRNIPIKLTMPNDSFWITSNEKGEYFANVLDSIVKVTPSMGSYWKNCQDTIIRYKGIGEEKTLNLPLQALINCPLLEVSLSTPRLRRCFDNTYSLRYCNRGTTAAKNAYVEIDFDKWLTVKASSIKNIKMLGNKYRFDLGEIKELECGNFTVTVNVDCDSTILGQTHCSTAHIFPDSSCIVDNGWDKSSIALKTQCENGKVKVEIKNIGTSPTSEPRQSIVIEDQIMMLQTPVNLGVGETKQFTFDPKGKTIRMIVEQAKNHPSYNNIVTAAVEGCGGTAPSLGFVTQFSESDNEPWLDTDCRQNIGAYDPNEKSASPFGYGALHQIEPNTELEYQINFQNEGTDTAFTVVLRDTIDNNLEISTLQMGASSHPYTWTLQDRGTLKVIFNNIHLTTKKENEAFSQGFVRYRIAQNRNVTLGTVLKNRAGIYFDFNKPIITNTTTHLVSKNFVMVAVPDVLKSNLKVSIAPNPFREQTIFKLENADDEPFILQIFDNMGRLMHLQNSDNRQAVFQNILPQGIYFYRIENEKGSASGKLIVY